jgi:predicted CDP-diglyceride synthetase/phosphatidate cytidylyltransferase
VNASKKAIVIVVPFIQLQNFRKIQARLIRELEKKFSGRNVVIIAKRRCVFAGQTVFILFLFVCSYCPPLQLQIGLIHVHMFGWENVNLWWKYIYVCLPFAAISISKFRELLTLFTDACRILKKIGKKNTVQRQKRPFSRTATAVHTAILEDLTYPVDIVKKRTRVRSDTSKLLKIYLDPKEQSNMESKVDTFTAVYKRLTGKDATFEFAANEL